MSATPVRPTRLVTSPDGVPIAVFSAGNGPPLVLVHGAAADHTTFRVVGPRLAERFTIHAIDRRGRGASGDGTTYALEREFDDLAAVVDAVAAESEQPVDVVGHSFGGRVALGASLRTPNVRRLVIYESAPAAPGRPYAQPGLAEELATLRAAGRSDELYATFLRRVVGMAEADIAAYRAEPVWPVRVAAAPTIVRELEVEGHDGTLDALGGVAVPVLQLLGGDSPEAFRAATAALHARLANGRVVVIDGARHAAHHSHPDRFVAEVVRFVDRAGGATAEA